MILFCLKKKNVILAKKKISIDNRVKSTSLKLRFNQIKNCKNILQKADKNLNEAMKSYEKNMSKISDDKHQGFNKFLRWHKFMKLEGQQKSILKKETMLASQLILTTYFSLPPRIMVLKESDCLRSINMPWLCPHKLTKDWSRKCKSWKGRLNNNIESTHRAPNLNEIVQTREQIAIALDQLQKFKENLKTCFMHFSKNALQAEEEILIARNEIFQTLVNDKKCA